MNIPQRVWRVVRGRLLLARQRSREPAEAVVDLSEMRAMADAMAELAEPVAAAPRTPTERPGSRRIPPATGAPRRDPLESYFRELALAPNADLAALDAAYQARLAEIHPELHPVGSPEREAGEARKAAVDEAYERLRDAINVTETRFEKLELDLVRRLRDLALVGLALAVGRGAIAAAPARGVPFTVIETNGEPQLRLAAPLARTVKRGFPEYRLPRSADEDPQMRALCREMHPESRVAGAAWGDFNGDGLKDAALHLRRPRSRDAGLVVAFHATRAGGYQPHVLERWQRTGSQFCVTRVQPGAINYVREGGTARNSPAVLQLRHDGIELLLPGVASRLFYWDGKRYGSVATSD